jgi:hypothetical protein
LNSPGALAITLRLARSSAGASLASATPHNHLLSPFVGSVSFARFVSKEGHSSRRLRLRRFALSASLARNQLPVLNGPSAASIFASFSSSSSDRNGDTGPVFAIPASATA